ncbi:MAG TPA: Calx-beta domain-containing protein [Thermoanaerobaculia bacterium]|jgi:plastocyanin|nr:Calx-beta domain-containing protein [Thermoanaerobaculia bacterium]
MRSRRSTLPALALGLLLTASAWGQHHTMNTKVDYDPEPGGGDPNVQEGCPGVTAKITIGGSATSFSPATITVDAGQPVCWTWNATSSHNVKADDGTFTSGSPATSGTFQRTFTTPGTYGYYCQVHGSLTGGMRGTVIVRDTSGGGGEGPGTLQLVSTSYTVNENDGTLAITVERMGGSDGAASVKFATANGTAKAGKDFLPRAGILRWANGDGEPKTIEIPIKNDSAIEPDEAFSIKLSRPTVAALATVSAAVTIHDDDGGCSASVNAPSKLQAAGESASEIRLTWNGESTAASAFHIERRQPGGAFREIASVAPGDGSFLDSGLPGGSTFQYRIRAEGADGSAELSRIVAGATDGPVKACDETRALCLNGGRFEATVEWRGSAAEKSREARGVLLAEAPNSGLFALSPQEDLQLLINVHDGCAANDRYWLEFAAVTDAELTLKVRDTQTGRTWAYFNPAGSTPGPLRDVEAFKTCP